MTSDFKKLFTGPGTNYIYYRMLEISNIGYFRLD